MKTIVQSSSSVHAFCKLFIYGRNKKEKGKNQPLAGSKVEGVTEEDSLYASSSVHETRGNNDRKEERRREKKKRKLSVFSVVLSLGPFSLPVSSSRLRCSIKTPSSILPFIRCTPERNDRGGRGWWCRVIPEGCMVFTSSPCFFAELR